MASGASPTHHPGNGHSHHTNGHNANGQNGFHPIRRHTTSGMGEHQPIPDNPYWQSVEKDVLSRAPSGDDIQRVKNLHVKPIASPCCSSCPPSLLLTILVLVAFAIIIFSSIYCIT